MYYKINFSNPEMDNTLELSFMKGLPIWRISGASFQNSHIKTRLSAICKSLHIRLPRKTLYISFLNKVNYQQYLEFEFYIVWILLFLIKRTNLKPRSSLAGYFPVNLDGSCLLNNQDVNILEVIKSICLEPNVAREPLSLLQKLILQLARNNLHSLCMGPVGFGKTFNLIAVSKQLQSNPVQIDEFTSLHEIRQFSRCKSQPRFFHIDDLGLFQKSKLNAIKLLCDKTLYPNHFIIASCNPCACGNYLSKTKTCSCQAHLISNYYKKLGRPLLDRFDAILYHDQYLENQLSKYQSQILAQNTSSVKTSLAPSIQNRLNQYVYQYDLSNRKVAQLYNLIQAFSHKGTQQAKSLELALLCQDFYHKVYYEK